MKGWRLWWVEKSLLAWLKFPTLLMVFVCCLQAFFDQVLSTRIPKGSSFWTFLISWVSSVVYFLALPEHLVPYDTWIVAKAIPRGVWGSGHISLCRACGGQVASGWSRQGRGEDGEQPGCTGLFAKHKAWGSRLDSLLPRAALIVASLFPVFNSCFPYLLDCDCGNFPFSLNTHLPKQRCPQRDQVFFI